jgi:hypothetical protein
MTERATNKLQVLKFRFPRRITAVSPDTAVNCSLAAH